MAAKPNLLAKTSWASSWVSDVLLTEQGKLSCLSKGDSLFDLGIMCFLGRKDHDVELVQRRSF